MVVGASSFVVPIVVTSPGGLVVRLKPGQHLPDTCNRPPVVQTTEKACSVHWERSSAHIASEAGLTGEWPAQITLEDYRMQISIRTRDIELTDALRDQIERRLKFALDAFQDHVQDALVYLMDLNGPKGGVDKLAQITIRVPGVGELAVRETGTTMPAALNRATRRLKYRLSEALSAVETLSRESIRTAQAAA
jgi:ribosomal subunit interface protein